MITKSKVERAIEYAESILVANEKEAYVCKPAQEYTEIVLEILNEKLHSFDFPYSPSGIYRLDTEDTTCFYGEIMNFTPNKIAMWNTVNNQVRIITYKDIINLYPIKKYPDWIINQEK